MTRKLSVFVDESGDVFLPDKPGVSRFYILTGIIVVTDELETVRAAADGIRIKHGFTEMHSTDIRNEKRRLAALDDITSLNVKSYIFVVDKSLLDRGGGLSFKTSFYQYINKKFYEKFVRNWSEVDICADEYGTERFMKRFRDYLALDRLQLFPPKFVQRKSKDEVLLQCADMVGGAIKKCIDPEKPPRSRSAFIQLLDRINIGIICWPPRLSPTMRHGSIDPRDSSHDIAIREYCFQQAREFLSNNKASIEPDNDDSRVKADAVERLLYVAEWIDDKKWVSTPELLNSLMELGHDINAEKLRRSVIGPLRDEDLIIASSTMGYKLPVCISDVRHFVEHANAIVPPMLKRLQRARDNLKLKTAGALDILASEEFSFLQKLLKADSPLENSQMSGDPRVGH